MPEKRKLFQFCHVHLLEGNLFRRGRRVHCQGGIRTGTRYWDMYGMQTGLSYTVMLKRNTEMLPTSNYPSYLLHPLLHSTAVTPQHLITSLEKIFHGETPSQYDEHCTSTLKAGKEMKGVHHLFQDHRERKRKETNSLTATVLQNTGIRIKKLAIHPNNSSFYIQEKGEKGTSVHIVAWPNQLSRLMQLLPCQIGPK